jgi:hypothetical protein
MYYVTEMIYQVLTYGEIAHKRLRACNSLWNEERITYKSNMDLRDATTS